MSDFKGVWIPAKVWECKELKIIEKHFLCQIESLDNANGCFASNSKFAEFFDISNPRCTQIIKKLESKGFIKVTLQRDGLRVVKRVINLLNKGSKLFKEPSKKTKEPSKFIKEGVVNLLKDSNIKEESNIISNKESKETHPQEIQLELEKLKRENLELKKEKEKAFPKSSAKKVFQDAPPTEEEFLQQHGFGYIPNFEITLTNYPFNGWSETLKDNFKRYCVARESKEKEKNPRYSYNESQVKENLRHIESGFAEYGMNVMELAVEEAISPAWTKFFPKRIKNTLERERIQKQKDEEFKQKNKYSQFKGDTEAAFAAALQDGYYDDDTSGKDDSWTRDMFKEDNEFDGQEFN